MVAEHPFKFVYVNTLVPGESAVNKPLLDTDPMAAVPEAQGVFTAGVPLPVNCKVLPTHTLLPPEMFGLGFTVTVCCAVVAH